jgi:hypothetical protein
VIFWDESKIARFSKQSIGCVEEKREMSSDELGKKHYNATGDFFLQVMKEKYILREHAETKKLILTEKGINSDIGVRIRDRFFIWDVKKIKEILSL